MLVLFSQSFYIVTIDAREGVENDHNIYLIAKDEVELAASKFGFSFRQNITSSDESDTTVEEFTGSLKDYQTLTEDDKKYQNCLLTIKEVINDYVDLRSHSVVMTDEN